MSQADRSYSAPVRHLAIPEAKSAFLVPGMQRKWFYSNIPYTMIGLLE